MPQRHNRRSGDDYCDSLPRRRNRRCRDMHHLRYTRRRRRTHPGGVNACRAAAQSSRMQQPSMWSLTKPSDCMKA